MIKHTLTLWMTAATLGVGQALAQEAPAPPPLQVPPPAPAPAAPPAPPKPPEPPAVGDRVERRHRERADEPTTFLGVGVEPVPEWVGEQLGLPESFGLLVNYVTPGSAAEAAGVQRHDVLKQINDQMLANPEQLSALVQSYRDGQEVTLTLLRRGKETKVTAKLQRQKEDAPEDRPKRREKRWRYANPEEDDRTGAIHVPPADEILKEIRPDLRELAEQKRDIAEKVRRSIMIMRDKEDGGTTRSKLDLERGNIVIHDDKGVLVIQGTGKDRVVVAKDPHGKLIYNGSTKDVPPGVMDRVIRFGEGGKIEIHGGDKGSVSVLDDEDGDDDKAEAAPTPGTAPASPAAGKPGA